MVSNAPSLVYALVGDAQIAGLFGEPAEVSAMLTFEAALAEAQGALGIVPVDAAQAIRAACEAPFVDVETLRSGMARDGVPVPALVKLLRVRVGTPHDAFVHFGATSQDIVDTGLMLRLHQVLAILGGQVDKLLARLSDIAAVQGATPLMAQTRMQAALPFTAASKLATWQRPLASHRARLDALRSALPIQLGGPVGDGAAFGPHHAALRGDLAARLGLADAEPWQSDRTPILDVAQGFALLTGTLGKVGQDIALMAQSEVGAVALSGGGGSSAMAHKRNPVGAETLVALARLNAGLLGTLSQSMVHENERSGAAWTLEWIVLPQMAESAARACSLADEILCSLRFVPYRDAGHDGPSPSR